MRGFCRTLLCVLVVNGITFAATDPAPKNEESNKAKVTKQKAAVKQSVSSTNPAQSVEGNAKAEDKVVLPGVAKSTSAADTKPSVLSVIIIDN